MTIIHMETDEVRYVASLLNQKVDDLLDLENSLKNAGSKASSAWSGGKKPTRFHNDFKTLRNSIKNKIAELDTLAVRLNREVNEWEEADSRFGLAGGSKLIIPPVTPPSGAVMPSPGGGVFDQIIDGITSPGTKVGKDVLTILNGVLINNPALGVILKWAGPIISVISGLAFYNDLLTEDLGKYSTAEEKAAAIIVDLLFTIAIQAIKMATTAAGLVMVVDGLKCALLGFFVGPALITAALGVVVWGGGWAVSELIKAGISNDNIRDSIIQAVAKGLKQPSVTPQAIPATA